MKKFDWDNPGPMLYFFTGAAYGFAAGGICVMRLLGW